MEEKEIHLRDYFRVLIRRKYAVFSFFILVAALTLISTFSATPVYMATTKVLIQKNESSSLTALNHYVFPYDPEFYDTQYQLIKSTSVAQKVVKSLSLEKTYDSFFEAERHGTTILSGTVTWFGNLFAVAGGSRSKSKSAVSGDSAEALKIKAEALAKTISNSIIVLPVKNTKLVNIGYESTNPEHAALIVNAVAKAYMDDMLEMRMSSSKNSMRWIAEKADEERASLAKSEKALQEYMRNKDIVTLENKIALLPERLAGVASKIAEGEVKRKELEALYSQVKEVSQDLSKAETMPVIASDPTVQLLRTQIMNAEQNISDLSKKYGQKHPSMIVATETLKALKTKREQEIRRVVDSIKNQYELAKTNEESFQKMGTQAKAETQSLSQRFIQYESLKRENETNKQLFELIVKKMKEQDITQDIKTVDLWVIEKAEVPQHPHKPRKLFNILVGLVLGLLGGVGMAFFVEYLDNTIKSPEDVETRLKVPVLGIVSLIKAGENTIENIILKEPFSAVAEHYKAIRTAVLLSSAVTPPKNVLITSISPGEGKTVTSVNLAVTIAQSENSVLLIDSDLRKPRIHKIFGLDNSSGLSTYLAGASELNIVPVAQLKGLSVLTSGPIPPNPSELLGSARMSELLKTLNERFDIIIWDSAPLMTVTDSLILSKILSGTILVAKAGSSTFDGLGRGLKAINDIEAHFLGIIINAVDIRKNDYYYYQNYNYQNPPDDKSGDKS
ncbi:MAG: polysaccharide biosynthesis tyrosine autokinase [Thermodesulfovibrionales bacterium]